MVETAATLIKNTLPRVPYRQFVISFPLRIRHYLENHATLQTVATKYKQSQGIMRISYEHRA